MLTIVRRESADGDRRERVAQGIEPAHAGQHVEDEADDREREIDVPERLGRLGDARRQLGVLDRAGRLRPVQLHAADAEHRQHGDGEDDDAHAAEPLQLLPVIENRPRQVVEAGQDRRAGRRQSRHGLEDRIGDRERQAVGEIQWRGAERAEYGPERCDHEEAVPQPQFPALAAHRQPADDARHQRQREALEKRQPGIVRIQQAEEDRRQHRQAEDHQEQPENALYDGPVHARASVPRRKKRQPGTASRGVRSCVDRS